MSSFSLVMTVEAHYVNGGIGSYVSELIAENQLGCRLVRCGIADRVTGHVGSQAYLYQLYQLSAEALAENALQAFQVS